MASTFISHLLEHGTLQKRISEVLQPAYGSRYRALHAAIEKHLVPLGVTLPQSDRDVVGGYFVWLTLPSAIYADKLAARCREEENVVVAPGSMFEVPGDDSVKFEHCARFCFAWETEENMAQGVKRVADVLGRMLKGEKGTNGASEKSNDAHDFW